MRIVIADDETLVRSTIKNMLLDLDFPLELVGEASNGQELIEMTVFHQPQLAFVDIRMPKINGLEAIRTAKEQSPQTRWIILSGSSDFQYAREAIRLGVKNYLLKPIDQNSLCECLEEIIQDCNQELIKLNDEFEFLVSSYVWGNRTAEDLIDLESLQFAGTLLCMDSSLSESTKLQLINKWLKEIHTYMRRTMTHKEVRYARVTLRNGDYAIIIAWRPAFYSDITTLRSELSNFIKIKMAEYKSDYFAVTSVQSERRDTIEALIQQISDLQSLSTLRAILPHSRLWSRNDLIFYEKHDKPLFEISQTVERIVRYYQSNDYLFYKKEAGILERQLAALPKHKFKAIYTLYEYFNLSIKRIFDADDSTDQWISKLFVLGEKLLPASANKDQANQDLINHVISHIEQHYMDDISIHQLATQFNITPNYLSTLFSKRSGVTFSKYITQFRMHKAEELLIKNPNLKVQDIALQLGYYSSSHFIKIFSEFHGCSPLQYREKLQEQLE